MGVIDSFGGKFRAFRSLQSWLSVSLFGGSLRWPAAQPFWLKFLGVGGARVAFVDGCLGALPTLDFTASQPPLTGQVAGGW